MNGDCKKKKTTNQPPPPPRKSAASISAFWWRKIFKLQGLEDIEVHQYSSTKTVEIQHISPPYYSEAARPLPCPFSSFYTAVIFSLAKFCLVKIQLFYIKENNGVEEYN